MSQNTQPNVLELLVRDARDEYRLATGDEVFLAARQVIGRRIRRGTSLTSPELVRDYLRTKLAELSGMFRCYVKKCGLKDFGLYDLKGKAATDMYRARVPL